MSIGHIWEFYKTQYVVDWDHFFSKKACEVTGVTTWDEYKKGSDGKSQKTDKVLGCRIKCIILVDQTDYKLKDTEIGFTNRLKEITFKLEGVNPSECKVHIGDKICGSAFAEQGGYWEPVIKDIKPYSTGGNGFMNDFSITVSGFSYHEAVKRK